MPINFTIKMSVKSGQNVTCEKEIILNGNHNVRIVSTWLFSDLVIW